MYTLHTRSLVSHQVRCILKSLILRCDVDTTYLLAQRYLQINQQCYSNYPQKFRGQTRDLKRSTGVKPFCSENTIPTFQLTKLQSFTKPLCIAGASTSGSISPRAAKGASLVCASSHGHCHVRILMSQYSDHVDSPRSAPGIAADSSTSSYCHYCVTWSYEEVLDLIWIVTSGKRVMSWMPLFILYLSVLSLCAVMTVFIGMSNQG